MKQNLLKGEESPTETDIVGPAVPTELSSSHRLTSELASKWEKDAQLLAQYGSSQQADLLRNCSRQLFETISSENDVLLTLAVAASITGYSPDHLGKLVRQGTVKNYGRKHSPKLRLADLPKKPTTVVGGNSSKYDVDADARSTLGRARRVS